MRAQLTALLISAVIAITLAQQLPIPARYDGHSIGNPSAPILLEEFFDLQCPDCKQAHPVIQQLLSHYGPNTVYYIQHIYPLQLHRQAWDASKAAAIVAKYSPKQYFAFIDYVFDHQSEFYNGVFFNKTERDLYDLFASYAVQFGVPKATFWTEMNGDYAADVARSGKNLGISRQVYGTPTYFINGVKATQLNEDTTLQQWIQVIDGLLSANKQ
jgi:protein-disulfide isomerase